MEIRMSQENARVPVTVLSLTGELDASSYRALEEQAQAAYDQGARYMILDLTQVPYMSSAGLRALNTIYNLLSRDAPDEDKKAAETGVLAGTYTSHHLRLVNPPKRVLDVIKMTGMDMFLDIQPTVRQALARF